MQHTASKLAVNIIGAGKLGKTIARLIVTHQIGHIIGVCNSSLLTSQQAVAFIGEGQAYTQINELPSADLTFITVPDDNIKSVCDELSCSKQFNPTGMIVHCSGLLTSDVLHAAKLKGCSVASVHPMRSFAEPEVSIKQFTGTYCAIEGCVEAEKFVRVIFEKIGGKIITIQKDKKAAYHAAGVFASNYLITLAYHAIEQIKSAGIHDDDALSIITNLMQSTLTNLSTTKSAKQSLTGPIKRGDIQTIKAHLSIMHPELKKLYALLGQLTLEITTHEDEKKQMLKSVLHEHEC